MAKAKQDALKADDGAIIPRIKQTEQGFNGLKTSNKQIVEEAQRVFRYPAFIYTVREMRNNPTVGAALNVYYSFMMQHDWCLKAPTGSSDIEIERAKIAETMMHDMNIPWKDFISSVISFLEYGFCVHEVIPYRRLYRNGSKWNDGLVGVKKLAFRNQETISGWEYDDYGVELLKIYQDPRHLEHGYLYAQRLNAQGKIEMDADRCLLIKTGANKGNPEGNSILKNIYLAYKQLTLLQEHQIIGVAKEMQGMLKIGIPPNYLDPNGSDLEKSTALAFQKLIDKANNGELSGLLVPQQTDPETKAPMFSYEFMDSKGIVRHNVESIIRGYQQDILTALSVDVLRLGADGTGSFSLAESKTSILTMAVDSRMREIQSALNSQLVRKIYEWNGWNTDNLPTFEYSKDEDLDMDSFGQFIQRTFSVGAVELDRDVMNKIRKVLGVEPLPEDEPVNKDALSTSMAGTSSSASKGMAVGTNGTGTSKIGGDGSNKDSSTSNNSNSA